MEHPTNHEPRETKYDRARQASRELFGDRRRRLEVGHASYVAIPGYDPRYFDEGTVITTVDPYRDKLGLTMGNNTPPHETDVRLGYSREAMEKKHKVMLERYPDIRILPEYTHLPVRGDGRELPFADQSFDETLLHNVVSDPGIPEKNLSLMLSEALRVADRVIISQDNTPGVAEERLEASNLSAQGLNVKSLKVGQDKTPEDRAYFRALGILEATSVYVLTKDTGYDPQRGIMLASHADQMEWVMSLQDAQRREEQEADKAKQAAEKRDRRAKLLARFGLRR